MMANQKYMDDLSKVVTVSEVCKMYGIKHNSSVIRLIWKGDLVGQQSESIWLVSLDSAIAWYGKPKFLP